MEKLGKLITSLILCLLCSFNVSCKHNNKEIKEKIVSEEDNNVNLSGNDEPACFDSIFQSVKEVEKYAFPLTKEDQFKDLLLNNARVVRWVSKIDSSKIVMFTLCTRSNKYLILHSQQTESTGLASNFYNWLLIDVNKESVIQDNIMSLSKDGRSWFIKNDTLHFILLKYGDEFYHNEHDYDNLPLNVIEYTIKDDIMEKYASSDIVCSGKQ